MIRNDSDVDGYQSPVFANSGSSRCSGSSRSIDYITTIITFAIIVCITASAIDIRNSQQQLTSNSTKASLMQSVSPT